MVHRNQLRAHQGHFQSEREYLQLDKEALEVLFAAKKFHQFLYDRHFIIYTDHKPLLGLLNPDKSAHIMASGRMKMWALAFTTNI